MNKKLLTAAVGAALVASPMLVAQADVKVYGRVQVDVLTVDPEGTGSTLKKTTELEDVGQSRWGISASEDLGGGMKGLAVLEFAVKPDDATPGAGKTKQRQQWVGLQSKAGTIALGTFNSPYKSFAGTAWDPWTATAFEARNNGGMSAGGLGHTSFVYNGIMYTSPTMSGWKGQVYINPEDAENSSGTAASSEGDGNVDYSFGVSWTAGPVEVVFAHSKDRNGASSSSNTAAKLTKLGVRFKAGPHTFAGQYEKDDKGLNAPSGKLANDGMTSALNPGTRDGDILWFNYQFKLGNNIFTASLGKSDYDATPGSSTGAFETKYMALGIIHMFSKTMRGYFGYRSTDNKGPDVSGSPTTYGGSSKVWGVGLRKDF